MGDHDIGVRSNTAALDAALRRLLAAHLVEDVAAPPFFSVGVNRPAGRVAKPLHVLFQRSTLAVRTRSPRRVVHALVRLLSAAGRRPPGLLELDALLLVRDGTAVLAPAALRARLSRLEPPLRRVGVLASDDPLAWLDPATGEVVVPPPALTLDPSGWAELSELASEPLAQAGLVEPGRYRLGAWLFAPGDDALRPAERVIVMAMQARNLGQVAPQRALTRLAAVCREVPAVALPPGTDRDHARSIAGAFEA